MEESSNARGFDLSRTATHLILKRGSLASSLTTPLPTVPNPRIPIVIRAILMLRRLSESNRHSGWGSRGLTERGVGERESGGGGEGAKGQVRLQVPPPPVPHSPQTVNRNAKPETVLP